MDTTFKHLEQIIVNRRNISASLMNGTIIEDGIINKILALANWAPTHAHTEPWRFIVYNHLSKQSFCEAHAAMYKQHTPAENFVLATYEKLQHMADKASHIVIAYAKRGDNVKIPAIEETVATSIAIQNFLLGAYTLNIAVHYTTGGMTHKQPMKDYFNLKDEDTILGVFYLGYTNEEKTGKRVSDITSKVEWR